MEPVAALPADPLKGPEAHPAACFAGGGAVSRFLYRGHYRRTKSESQDNCGYCGYCAYCSFWCIGRTKPHNQPVLQALGIISFDDEAGTFHRRAFNDGRFLETEVKLFEDGESLTWGFALGTLNPRSVLRINEKGKWPELAEITIDSQPARRLLELTVRRLAWRAHQCASCTPIP